MNHGTWKLFRQWCALGLLAWLFWGRVGIKCVQLSFNGLKVDVKQIIEQAALLWTDLFAALGVLVALEDSDLISELLDDDLRFEACASSPRLETAMSASAPPAREAGPVQLVEVG